jgi:hypothetical protein
MRSGLGIVKTEHPPGGRTSQRSLLDAVPATLTLGSYHQVRPRQLARRFLTQELKPVR